jgi:phenylacetate-CoA ligase
MYSSIYENFRKYIWKGNQEIRRCIREMKNTEWISREELETIQLKKLKQLVDYAYNNIPFYYERYQREDIHPSDINSLKDFQALPFLTREDVQQNLQTLVSPAYQGSTFTNSTAGSTGQPMRFVMEFSAAYHSYAIENRCRGWYRVGPADKVAWIWGNLRDFPGWNIRERAKAYFQRRRYLNSRTLTEQKMQEFAKMLIRWKPAIVIAYPSALGIFAGYLNEQRIFNINPKLVEVGGEKITPEQRQMFEDVFRAPVANYYGSWESGVLAYDCPAGNLHVMENRYIEAVSNNTVVAPGQMGEIVITSLNHYAMPFIRYKIGDVGIIETTNCSCGRSMPVLREVTGRTSDLLVDTDNRLVHWSSFYTIMRKKPEVLRYQLYQPDREHIKVRLESKQELEPAYLENIKSLLQPCFGENMMISVELVDQIELTPAGKLRSIISDVKPELL